MLQLGRPETRVARRPVQREAMMRLIVLAATILAAVAPAFATPAEDFHRLMDEEYRWLLRENPTRATALGVRDYDTQIRDISPAARDRRVGAGPGLPPSPKPDPRAAPAPPGRGDPPNPLPPARRQVAAK